MNALSQHSPDAEGALIGCCLRSDGEFDALDHAVKFGITAENFFVENCAVCFRQMQQRRTEGNRLEAWSLAELLARISSRTNDEAALLVETFTRDPAYPADH